MVDKGTGMTAKRKPWRDYFCRACSWPSYSNIPYYSMESNIGLHKQFPAIFILWNSFIFAMLLHCEQRSIKQQQILLRYRMAWAPYGFSVKSSIRCYYIDRDVACLCVIHVFTASVQRMMNDIESWLLSKYPIDKRELIPMCLSVTGYQSRCPRYQDKCKAHRVVLWAC